MKQRTRIKRGQTIAAEREAAESESERMQARKQLKRKHRASVILVLLLMVVLGGLGYVTMRDMVEDNNTLETNEEEAVVAAEIVDEMGRDQISERTRQYIAQIEGDFKDLGYKVTRVTLPMNTSRELLVDLADQKPYFRVSLDRETAVSAEDAVRMLKYLNEHKLEPTYVDVRIEGKAYYK